MRTTLVASWALVWLLAGYSRWTARAAEDPAEVAARTRQEAVKTLMVVYKRTEVVARGAESDGQEGLLKPKMSVPDKEMTLESTNRLVIDGQKVRIEDNHPKWLMPTGELLQVKKLSLCDGSVAKSYSEGLRNDGKPVGCILNGPRLDDIKFIVLVPMTLTVRGLDPNISPLPMGDMKRSEPALLIRGVTCEEYALEYGKNTKTTCWLDASKEYAARRIRTERRGRLSAQIDITAYRHEAGGWIPTSWVCNQYSPAGAVLRTDKVEVLELRINEPQPAHRFELQFPNGTFLADARNGKYYRVQPDGNMREISANGELPTSVPQPGSPWYRRHRWLIASLTVILAVAGILYAVRKRRVRPA